MDNIDEGSIDDFTTTIMSLSNKLFESYYSRGHAKFKQNDFVGAMLDFRVAINLNPASKEAYLALADALIEHNKEIIINHTKTIQWYPFISWSYVELAKAKRNLNESDGMDDLEMAVELAPENKKAIYDKWDSKDFEFNIMECHLKAIELDPEYITAYISRGDLLVWNGNYNGAIDYYNSAIQKSKESFVAFKKRGDAYCHVAGEFEAWAPLQIHNYALAVSDYTEAIRINKDYAEAYDARGLVKFLQSNFQGSVEDYDHAIRINPNYDRAYHNRAEAKINLDNLDGAFTDYTIAIQLNPKSAESFFKRADLHERNGNFAAAISDYTSAVNNDPKLFEACKKRKALKIKLFEVTIQDYTKAIELNSKDSMAYYHRALAKANTGDDKGAIEDSNIAIELDPNFADAYLNRAYSSKSLNDGEIEDYSKAISLNPLNHEAYFYRGCRKKRAGDLKGAIEDFSSAIKFNPNDDVAYMERGYLSFNMKDFAQAVKDLTYALKINPEDSEPNFSNSKYVNKDQTSWVYKEKIIYCHLQNFKLANIYLTRAYSNYYLGNYSEAIFNFKRAITLWDDLENFHFQSILSFLNKDIVRAINYIDRAILLNPKDGIIYYNRGIYKIHLSLYKESIEDFSKLISMKKTEMNPYLMRGYALCRSSNISLAIADFEKAAEINMQYSSIYNRFLACKADMLSQEDLAFLDAVIDFNPKVPHIPSHFF